jgi:hypothetical protein
MTSPPMQSAIIKVVGYVIVHAEKMPIEDSLLACFAEMFRLLTTVDNPEFKTKSVLVFSESG